MYRYTVIQTAGKNYQSMKAYLEKRYKADTSLSDAIGQAILTLRDGAEGELTKDNIEIGIVDNTGIFRVLSPEEVQGHIDEIA